MAFTYFWGQMMPCWILHFQMIICDHLSLGLDIGHAVAANLRPSVGFLTLTYFLRKNETILDFLFPDDN